MHTHGQLWILPYNHHKRTYPEDFKDLERLATKAAEKVYSYRETKYRVGTAADMLGSPCLEVDYRRAILIRELKILGNLFRDGNRWCNRLD
ncbi:unnamed protein product [Strongylus vulgaris]|uniref:Peptidase M14 domain-containing protein n=1 Tax=Strongylus vulgaris TaxID=40348 RepID=A0A3P7LS89_STRVU|nr:unnamed protein product [Strongylus vulgaris]